ncbi:glycerophosphodiester phosphodiesterase [Anaerosporobacter faecicola]|uniref:glycerophosphodiester phosphodiesterase n=1 Tax=Anaerosporobacter faecicola TaxID=2718714 RepID=UPI001438817B|nr:glycerophosphodiester phosphodiesterase [Anaerosporobacter faecicola]
MKVIAHRGFSGIYPENTMLSFEKAVEAGCDVIELDVQETKDHVLVIIHDETIKRTTDGEGYVRKYTFEELRKFNAASIKKNFDFLPIPSFEEYVAWAKTTSVTTNIELKNNRFYYTDLEKKVIDLLQSYDMLNRVMFSSFNHVSMLKCKQLAPDVPCGFLTEKEIGNAGYYVKSSGLDCYHPDVTNLSETVVKNCKKHGVAINAWTVNEMGDLRKLYDWGISGAITNYPDICKAFVNNANKNL